MGLDELSAVSDPEAQARLRDQLVMLNVGVARSIARRYHHRGLEDHRVPRRIQETQSHIFRADPDVDGRDRCSNAKLDDLAVLGESLADEDDWTSVVEARSIAQLIVRRLDARDQRVVSLRYVHEWTQKAIAEELGVSKMQVSRTLARIHHHLRAELHETRPHHELAAPSRFSLFALSASRE